MGEQPEIEQRIPERSHVTGKECIPDFSARHHAEGENNSGNNRKGQYNRRIETNSFHSDYLNFLIIVPGLQWLYIVYAKMVSGS